jgi:hypothetical protein
MFKYDNIAISRDLNKNVMTDLKFEINDGKQDSLDLIVMFLYFGGFLRLAIEGNYIIN